MAKTPDRSLMEKRAKAIKGFVSFSVRDKTIKPKSLSAKIRRYYNLIYGSEGNPGLYNPATDVPMRPRGKAFAAVRDSEGQPAHRGIKVVFVETVPDPTNPDKLLKPRFKIKGGKVSKSNFDVTTTFYPFRVRIESILETEDPDALEEAFSRDVKRILANAPQVRSWAVKCGKRQTADAFNRQEILPYVLSLLNRYQDTINDWLAGLVAIEFETTAALHDFLADREKLRKGKSGSKARRRNRR